MDDSPERWPGQHRFADVADRHGTAYLARMLNVSNATISHWKVGRRTPPVASLVELAQRIPLSLDWLLLGKRTPNKTPSQEIALDDTQSLHLVINVGQKPNHEPENQE